MEERALRSEVEIIREGNKWMNFADQPGSRGSRPSESQMDDPNVMVETLESGRRLHSLSPRKQVGRELKLDSEKLSLSHNAS